MTTPEIVGRCACSLACIGGFNWFLAYFPSRPVAVSLMASPLLALSLWAGATGAHALTASWVMTVMLLFVFWGAAFGVALVIGEQSDVRRRRTQALLASPKADDRIWAATNISDLRLLQGLLADVEPRVRGAAIPSIARGCPFLQAIEALRSPCRDPNGDVRKAALDCFWQLGGDLLHPEWLALYDKLRALPETDRQRLTLHTTRHEGRTTVETQMSGPTELTIETRRSHHGVVVPEVCCLCALNSPTVRRDQTWQVGESGETVTFALSLGFCRLCAHAERDMTPVRVEGVRPEHGGLAVAMSFLNDEIGNQFWKANSGTRRA